MCIVNYASESVTIILPCMPPSSLVVSFTDPTHYENKGLGLGEMVIAWLDQLYLDTCTNTAVL